MREGIVLFLFAVILTGCSDEKAQRENVTANPSAQANMPVAGPQIPVVIGVSEESLTGSWKVNAAIQPNGDTIRKNDVFTFKADHTFTRASGKIIMAGSWQIINDGAGLLLTADNGKKEEFTDIIINGNTGSLKKKDKKFLMTRE